jgi:diguanylate cyclase (GGDEF)-like protein/PAS domain S-box-containing protein
MDNGSEAEPPSIEHASLLRFLYLSQTGIIQTQADGTVRMINPYAQNLLVVINRTPLITNLFTMLESCAPELRNMAERFSAERGTICTGYRVRVSASGPLPHILSCSITKVDSDCLMVVLQDISREVEQERQLRQNETLFAALVTGVKDFALLSLDSAGRISAWNPSSTRLTSFDASVVIGHSIAMLCHGDAVERDRSDEQVRVAAREGWSLRETRCLRRDGSTYWCQILIAATENPSGWIEGYSVVMRDVTERRMTAEELRRLLTTDHLTGATNRSRFFELAAVEQTRANRFARPLAVVVFDVDHFKRVNDGFGHATGDAVLRALVASCRASLDEGAVLARLGGEEFGVLLPGADLAAAMRHANLLRETTARDLAVVDGKALGVTISLGCAAVGDSGIDTALRAADAALYRAKRGGRNRVGSSEATPDMSPARIG